MALGIANVALAQPMPSMSAPPPGATSQALPTPDFLTAAAQSDAFEVKEGHMAEMRGRSARVRAMGAMMVQAHTQSTVMMKAAAHRAGMPPMGPPGLDAGQQQMVAALQAAPPSAFDRMYVDQQLKAHHMTLGVMSAYVSNGPPGPIRATAAKIVPIVRSHIAKFEALQTSMS
jgi:putative membrane protein